MQANGQSEVGQQVSSWQQHERLPPTVFPVPGAIPAGRTDMGQQEEAFLGADGSAGEGHNGNASRTAGMGSGSEGAFYNYDPSRAYAGGAGAAGPSYEPPYAGYNTHRPHADQHATRENDAVTSFLAEMPTQREDPSRHVMWTELIKLKTRSLELQIAEARRREREAELEILRLKAGAAARSDMGQALTGAGPSVPPVAGSQLSGGHEAYHLQSQQANAVSHRGYDTRGHLPQAQPQQPSQSLQTVMPSSTQPVDHAGNTTFPVNMFGATQDMSPFDLEAMLQSDNVDSLLSWLPDLGDGFMNEMPGMAPSMEYTAGPPSLDPASVLVPAHDSIPQEDPPTQGHTHSSPIKRRSHSPVEDDSPHPPTKKAKKGIEKKVVTEQTASCLTCHKLLARVMIRSPRSQVPDPISVHLRCPGCLPVDQPSTLPDQGSSSGGSGTVIGTVETRKRMRSTMEIDDEDAKAVDRRTWCDVCQRIVGSGQIVGGKEGESLASMAEIVCVECDSKYQRCTDCGGGGGPRVGIGKWRMKQVFHPGRKTCSLSHTRLGDRTRELGVHVTPTDFTPEQMKEVLLRCKALWNEKTLSRLAVPEMLEVDLPPGLTNPLRDYGDVDDMVTRNWPSREAMIKADGLDPSRFKRLLSLIWSHSKPRRTVRTVDLEEEWSKQTEDIDDDLSTVLAHVKRTNVVIPPGSELIGMWGGEWDMLNGSLLISTFIPFEGADGEDSTALCVGEMITKVQALQQDINGERVVQAEQAGLEPDLLPPCSHLWTVSGGYIPLVRERFADILIRKRSFVHVEEYLTRHPEFIESIKARPVGLHPDIVRSIPESKSGSSMSSQAEVKPLILVRWLGKEWDHQKILEIKRMEFGRKKKRTKSKP
ncbi:hypothetical protein IAU60_005898 [Kwoniella sp. DSM 27419]